MQSSYTDWRRPAETAGRLARLTPLEQDIIRIASRPGFDRWLQQMRATGGCAHPVYISGHTTVWGPDGNLIRHYDTRDEPGGQLAVRCRNRREVRCPPCARLHAGDTYQLVRAGLDGGKGLSKAVSARPRLFVTLTGPTFGAVHRKTAQGISCRFRRRGTCPHGRPMGCGARHDQDDGRVGQPFCPACYDYAGHVLWNASTGALWKAATDNLYNKIAALSGLTRKALRKSIRLSYAKVAEYQRRGLIHFHAVIRIDGPDGPESTPPPWATLELLDAAIRDAVASVRLAVPYSPALGERELAWGQEIDITPIRAFGDGNPVTASAVAGYIAKYTSKGTSDVGGVDTRIETKTDIATAAVSGHIRALMGMCWRLGSLPELEYLRLKIWAHTLGYRGHVLTKSRKYSTTYGALRDARAEHNGILVDFDDGTTVDSEWRYVGSGHSWAEAEFAEQIAEEMQVAREELREKEARSV